MNKRNFFKGLMALLAMPSNIYAKALGKAKQPDFPYLFDSTVGTFAKEARLCSLDQMQVGMFFTTTAAWGKEGIIFEVVGLVGSNHAFVTPRKFPSDPDWPTGMARLLYFEQAKFSEFTFYVRA